MTSRISDFGGLGDRVARPRAAEEQQASTQAQGRHVYVHEGIRDGVPRVLVALSRGRPGLLWSYGVVARLLKPAPFEATPNEAGRPNRADGSPDDDASDVVNAIVTSRQAHSQTTQWPDS